MKRHPWLLVGWIFSLGFGPIVAAASDHDAIVAVVEEYRSAKGIPGLSLAIMREGEIWWEMGSGLADVENGVAATADTRYRLASISKPVTAVAFMRLVQERRIDLDAPIQRYCPEFPVKRSPRDGRNVVITARQILQHTSGIRHYIWDQNGRSPDYDSTYRYATVKDALSIFARDPLVADPDSGFHYSTFSYTVLACAIENVTDRSFMDHLREAVLVPAGMTTLRDDDQRALIPGRARGYTLGQAGQLENSELADTSIKVAGGGMIAAPRDLVALAKALHHHLVLDRATQQEMLTIHHRFPDKYGLGWTLDQWQGKRTVSHTGSQHQVSTALLYFPEEALAIAVMLNLEDARAMDLARALATRLLPGLVSEAR